MTQEEKDQDKSDLEDVESEVDSLIKKMKQLNEMPAISKRSELLDALQSASDLVTEAQNELDEIEVDSEEEEEEEPEAEADEDDEEGEED